MARKTGWERPFHCLQLITWFFFPLLMSLFFALYTPLLDMTAAILGTSAYVVTAIVLVYAVYICTGTDPSDDCILQQAGCQDSHDTHVHDDQVYCNVCVQYVHKESRHCRLCDKCVARFDHHCKWLNNCVGKKNYKYFFTSVIAATLLLSLQLAFGIYLIVASFSTPDVLLKRSATVYGCSGSKTDKGFCADDDGYRVTISAIKIFHIVFVVLTASWWLLMAQLALFHVQLTIEDITTYDYIVRKRKRKLARERDNTIPPTCWEAFIERLTCQYKPPVSKPSGTDSSKQSQGSHLSSQHIEDEHDAIEAEVDDDLEVTSSRSSRSSFPQPKSGVAPARGFGRHLSASSPIRTPTSVSEDTAMAYLEGPHTPRSPRSEPESAYMSDDSEHANRPLPAIPVASNTSMIMYGRPASSSAHNGETV
ncbi:TPA: hypothetical protein N0F65_009644 [Lagenidium giganteum]|uniref:Palmitoyltransferase n=1 Tax=Lagenidium giganteum TaxID=4803 RepID=A0AAV2YKA1_9STRA|nr:TPA: hypothetical protein N0F65_009644 [Lagenidium giganteum]